MVGPNFGGAGHQMEMQFGGPHMGIVRQPPPTSVPPPQTSMQHQASINHNPPPWIKSVGSQQMEVEQTKLTNQDISNPEPEGTVQPIEEVKMDICDTWEQEKVQRLTEEVEKFEQEVMNIEKSSKSKEKGDQVTEALNKPEKLAAKDKPENLSAENYKPGKLPDTLDKLATKDNKPDELAVENIIPEKKTVEDDSKVYEPAAENIPVELAVDNCKLTTETQSDDSITAIKKDDLILGNEKEDLLFKANEDAKKPREEISKELPMDDNNEDIKKDGTSTVVADDMAMAYTKVDSIQQTGDSIPSNETEDNHMLQSKLENDAVEQQPGREVGENKETKCDSVKGEEHHTEGDDAMDLQESSSETNEPATGDP